MPLGEDFYMKSLTKYVQSRDDDFIIGSSRRLTGVKRFEAAALRRLRIHIVNEHEKINYVEFPAKNIQATKEFFTEVFGWSFQDFGPDYTAFSNQGLDGGFYRAELHSSTSNGAGLIVFYSTDLEASQDKIEKANGVIVKPIFSFPGGRRFHFTEPSGNEFAVWSDNNA